MQMETVIKVTFKMGIKRVRVSISIVMVVFMKEIGSMTKRVVMGYLSISMEISIMDFGLMI